MHSRAIPARIEAVNSWLVHRFRGSTVASEDDFARSSRVFRVDSRNTSR